MLERLTTAGARARAHTELLPCVAVTSSVVTMKSSEAGMFPSASMIEAGVPVPQKTDAVEERQKKIEELYFKVTMLEHEKEDALAERDEALQARDALLLKHQGEAEEQRAMLDELTTKLNEMRDANASLTKRLQESQHENARLTGYVAELQELREANRSSRRSLHLADLDFTKERSSISGGQGSTLEDELAAADRDDEDGTGVLTRSAPSSPSVTKLAFDFGTSSAPLTRSPRLDKQMADTRREQTTRRDREREEAMARKDRQLKKLRRQLDELKKRLQEQQGGAFSDILDGLMEQLAELAGDDAQGEGSSQRAASSSPIPDASRRRHRAQTAGPMMQALDTSSTRSSGATVLDAPSRKKSAVRVRLQVREDKRDSTGPVSTAIPGSPELAEQMPPERSTLQRRTHYELG